MNETPQVTTEVTAAPVVETPQVTPQSTTPDSTELARQLGEAQTKLKDLEDYKGKVDPVLETLYSDSELLKKATEAHNRRLGIAPSTPPTQTTETFHPPVSDPDTRMALIDQISNQFEEKNGISKLDGESKKSVRGAVGAMLKDLLDPKGNKTMTQVFEEVSLSKLSWYLDQAYKLANHDNEIRAAVERGKSDLRSEYEGDRGMLGSMPGGSVSSEQVTLTPQEKQVAAKMGLTEEQYLNEKKATILSRQA